MTRDHRSSQGCLYTSTGGVGEGKRGWGGLLVKSMESRLRLLTSRRPLLSSPARLSQTVDFQPYRLTPTND